jgi:hypothetical protein
VPKAARVEQYKEPVMFEDDDQSLDLDFFADEDEANTSNNQDKNTIALDKEEYDALQRIKAQKEADEAKLKQAQEQQPQAPTVDAYVKNIIYQEAQAKEVAEWDQAHKNALQKFPELSKFEDEIVDCVSLANKRALKNGLTKSKAELIADGIEIWNRQNGQPAQGNGTNAMKYAAMNPDVRGNSPSNEVKKLTAQKISSMSPDKFKELDRVISQKLANGERVIL